MSLNPKQFDKFVGHAKFPMQLSMLEQAGDLANATQLQSLLMGDSPEELRRTKLAESTDPAYADSIRFVEESTGHMDDSPTLWDSIATSGVKRPVEMHLTSHKDLAELTDETHPSSQAFPALSDGHHRVAVQNEIDPHALVPVVWEDWRSPNQ